MERTVSRTCPADTKDKHNATVSLTCPSDTKDKQCKSKPYVPCRYQRQTQSKRKPYVPCRYHQHQCTGNRKHSRRHRAPADIRPPTPGKLPATRELDTVYTADRRHRVYFTVYRGRVYYSVYRGPASERSTAACNVRVGASGPPAR